MVLAGLCCFTYISGQLYSAAECQKLKLKLTSVLLNVKELLQGSILMVECKTVTISSYFQRAFDSITFNNGYVSSIKI